METWNGYHSEALAYYKTTVKAKEKGRPFGNLVYYNLIGLALEGFLTALITKDGDLPEHSSISSMLRMLKKKYEVPELFIEESRFYNKFMNFCSLEVLETLEPTDEEIDRMINFLAEVKEWTGLHLGLACETC
ncbi:hypothetical protein [Gaoshiqia sediminis]|uniref:Uncharacterized protein n=1 Tax=Gaoshiqia sediminis TaxID=2986998 RepID=A0AA42C964_9BACT|nr:hypothetical protein [Gaoshiqia sediminis]MCW0481715.1 hypothetical protein [Gaoshiqia sediminis]